MHSHRPYSASSRERRLLSFAGKPAPENPEMQEQKVVEALRKLSPLNELKPQIMEAYEQCQRGTQSQVDSVRRLATMIDGVLRQVDGPRLPPTLRDFNSLFRILVRAGFITSDAMRMVGSGRAAPARSPGEPEKAGPADGARRTRYDRVRKAMYAEIYSAAEGKWIRPGEGEDGYWEKTVAQARAEGQAAWDAARRPDTSTEGGYALAAMQDASRHHITGYSLQKIGEEARQAYRLHQIRGDDISQYPPEGRATPHSIRYVTPQQMAGLQDLERRTGIPIESDIVVKGENGRAERRVGSGRARDAASVVDGIIADIGEPYDYHLKSNTPIASDAQKVHDLLIRQWDSLPVQEKRYRLAQLRSYRAEMDRIEGQQPTGDMMSASRLHSVSFPMPPVMGMGDADASFRVQVPADRAFGPDYQGPRFQELVYFPRQRRYRTSQEAIAANNAGVVWRYEYMNGKPSAVHLDFKKPGDFTVNGQIVSVGLEGPDKEKRDREYARRPELSEVNRVATIDFSQMWRNGKMGRIAIKPTVEGRVFMTDVSNLRPGGRMDLPYPYRITIIRPDDTQKLDVYCYGQDPVQYRFAAVEKRGQSRILQNIDWPGQSDAAEQVAQVPTPPREEPRPAPRPETSAAAPAVAPAERPASTVNAKDFFGEKFAGDPEGFEQIIAFAQERKMSMLSEDGKLRFVKDGEKLRYSIPLDLLQDQHRRSNALSLMLFSMYGSENNDASRAKAKEHLLSLLKVSDPTKDMTQRMLMVFSDDAVRQLKHEKNPAVVQARVREIADLLLGGIDRTGKMLDALEGRGDAKQVQVLREHLLSLMVSLGETYATGKFADNAIKVAERGLAEAKEFGLKKQASTFQEMLARYEKMKDVDMAA